MFLPHSFVISYKKNRSQVFLKKNKQAVSACYDTTNYTCFFWGWTLVLVPVSHYVCQYEGIQVVATVEAIIGNANYLIKPETFTLFLYPSEKAQNSRSP